MGKIIDGKLLAERIIAACGRIPAMLPRKPVLAIVTVGNNPASEVYIRQKVKACNKAGIECRIIRLEQTNDDVLAGAISTLNADSSVDAIIVQLPLPYGMSTAPVQLIDPNKDVDGLSLINQGKLFMDINYKLLAPCTPSGIIRLLNYNGVQFSGKRVVIIGRSMLVGRPLAVMLEHLDATVTLCHSRTMNLEEHTRAADIVVVAVGQQGFLTSDMIKPGAIVVDVGINRVDGKIYGDCAEDVVGKAGMITPVPGGVGPMTVAMLIENTIKAADWKMYGEPEPND